MVRVGELAQIVLLKRITETPLSSTALKRSSDHFVFSDLHRDEVHHRGARVDEANALTRLSARSIYFSPTLPSIGVLD
jgi:hypothetical protein